MKISKDMIISNHQFYDRHSFDRHERTENSCNQCRVRKRDIVTDEMCLKDPRTGMNYEPGYTIQHLFITRPSHANLALFIKNRIPEITAEQINAFVFDEDDQKTNTADFINLIKTTTHLREVNSDVYTRHIQNLQRSAASNPTSPFDL